MNTIDLIEKNEIREYFCKNWLAHDGFWFAQCVNEIGIEKTNQINVKGIKMMAGMEIQRLLTMFHDGNKSFNDYTEFKEFLSRSIDFARANFMMFSFEFVQDRTLQIDVHKCWAYTGVKKLGFIDDYECAVFTRIQSWLDYLKIRYTLSPDFKKCLMHRYGNCSMKFIFSDFQ